MMVKEFLKFSPVFLLLVVIPSCSRRRPLLNVENEPLPTWADGSTYTKEQVRKTIFKACRQLGWSAQPMEEGLIEASYSRRASRAKIEIRYDETHISILYKDSYHLGYADGTIHRGYNRWIVYLYRTILNELKNYAQWGD